MVQASRLPWISVAPAIVFSAFADDGRHDRRRDRGYPIHDEPGLSHPAIGSRRPPHLVCCRVRGLAIGVEGRRVLFPRVSGKINQPGAAQPA